MPDESDQYSSLDSKKFIESNDRDTVVAYSYTQGINMQYTLHDDPTYFIGWEVRSIMRLRVSVVANCRANLI